ncbi:MAG: hypothetical protein JST43_11330 [Bacteroidetes bacterium]|nr:hypothetical protein [Bacteroidota bacterium]MBS1540023.1 hypothetical protein [Bacteroidota bacterium]
MKKLIALCCFTLATINLIGQDNPFPAQTAIQNVFAHINTTQIPTGYLQEYAVPLIIINLCSRQSKICFFLNSWYLDTVVNKSIFNMKPITIHPFMLVVLFCCSCVNNSVSTIISKSIVVENGKEQSFSFNIEGSSQNVRVILDSIVDKRPVIEDCPTIYTSLKYVYAYFEIQVGNQKTDTVTLTRRMCLPKGDLINTNINFSKKCVNNVCLGLVNITENSSTNHVDLKKYNATLLISNQ